MSRVFPNSTRMITTSHGGPCMEEVQTRRTWDLSSGKMIDECQVEDVRDDWLHRKLDKNCDIRVELVLKNALSMYERKGPDVSEIFSQPRVCHEAGVQRGMTLTPGWSLDLTTTDPATGEPWDLSREDVQRRVRKLVRETQPFCIVGSISTVHGVVTAAGDRENSQR